LLKFEQELKEYNKTFKIVEFKNLVLNDESDCQEIKNDNYLSCIINDEIPVIHHIIDYIKLSLNYYGFGYEKNLVIDLDHTPQSLGNGKQGEIDTFDYKIKFGIRNPSENDIGDQVTSLENQICFTKESRSVYLKTILSDIQNDLDYTKYNRSNNKFMFFTIKKCLF
jgi:hypothetical protein